MNQFKVRPLHHKREIYAFLARDRYYAAYPIGDLEPGFFEASIWWAAERQGEMTALALHFQGLKPPALFTMGSRSDLGLLLEEMPLPERAYLTGQSNHLGVFQRFFSLEMVEDMARMVLGEFHPIDGPTRKLRESDLPQLERLYRLSGAGIFLPYQPEGGVYYGVEVEGSLVSAAGTHIVAPTYGIAAVGNVFTLPPYRGRGYATACTSAVARELLGRSLEVVLNVARSNQRAVRIYERLGFREHGPFVEALGVKR